MSKNLFSNGFANLGFVHHGTACVSAAVRGVIHAKLFPELKSSMKHLITAEHRWESETVRKKSGKDRVSSDGIVMHVV